jgi:Septum formation
MKGWLALCAVVALALASMACQGNVFSLKVGDCFTGGAAGTEVSDVSTVDCGQAHDAEVFSIFDYPNPPSDFPGDSAMQAAAQDGCTRDFQAYVGVAPGQSGYAISYFSPTSDSWAGGDRTFDCLIASPDGSQLTGSAKGTAR